jgi:hypothetical protein
MVDRARAFGRTAAHTRRADRSSHEKQPFFSRGGTAQHPKQEHTRAQRVLGITPSDATRPCPDAAPDLWLCQTNLGGWSGRHTALQTHGAGHIASPPADPPLPPPPPGRLPVRNNPRPAWRRAAAPRAGTSKPACFAPHDRGSPPPERGTPPPLRLRTPAPHRKFLLTRAPHRRRPWRRALLLSEKWHHSLSWSDI